MQEYPLLDLVTADWFETHGWFASRTVQHERQLLDRLAEDCAVAKAAIIAAQESLSGQAAGDERRWLDLSVKWAVSVKLSGELQRLRAAVEALGYTYAASYPARQLLAQLDEYGQRLAQLTDSPSVPPDEASRAMLAELARFRREMLVDRHPQLRGAEIVFVKRHTYNSKHYYDDFQHISAWGGNLCVLTLANGQVREIVPQLAGGVFDRYDLSFDARNIVFGYRRPQPEGYRLYEIGVDGSGLRPVTQPPPDEADRIATYGRTSYGDGFYGLQGYQFWTDDVHPCYLPDGDIAFASTRSEHGVLCTPAHYLACTNLYRVNADGSGMRRLSNGALSEFTPTLMDDGRILFNRWEYVYKGIAATQPLWTMRPDGAGSEEFYGDNIANPGVFWQARQVPGHPRLAVCIGCGHEPLGVGQVLLLDLSKDKRSPLPMTNLTPDVKIQNLRGIFHRRNGAWREDYYGPLFADPYPLCDKFFLVSCNPAGATTIEPATACTCWMSSATVCRFIVMPRFLLAAHAPATASASAGSAVRSRHDILDRTAGDGFGQRYLSRTRRCSARDHQVPARHGAGPQALVSRVGSGSRRRPERRRVWRTFGCDVELTYLGCRVARYRPGRGGWFGPLSRTRRKEPLFPGAGRGLHGSAADAHVCEFPARRDTFLRGMPRTAHASAGHDIAHGVRQTSSRVDGTAG